MIIDIIIIILGGTWCDAMHVTLFPSPNWTNLRTSLIISLFGIFLEKRDVDESLRVADTEQSFRERTVKSGGCEKTPLKGRHLRPVRRVADPRVVVEQNANTPVAQLEAKAVLVAVVDPLGDEHGALLAGQHARLLPRRHHHQRRSDCLVQRCRSCSRSRLLIRRVGNIVVVVGVVVLVLVGEGEGEDGGGEGGDVRQGVGGVVRRLRAARWRQVRWEETGGEEKVLKTRF